MLSNIGTVVNPVSIPEYEKTLFNEYKSGHKVKYHFCKNGNIKLGGRVWTWSKTYSGDAFFVNDFGGYITGTCCGYCAGCAKECYVKKSYRYGSVILNHAINACGIRYDMAQVFDDLRGQLTRARKKPAQVRIHQSGELESYSEFAMWCGLAKEFPEIAFYIYSKAYDIVIPALVSGIVPENLTVNISVWHEYGVREFYTVWQLPNVKAFVYDDGFDYTAYGLNAGTWCKAYDDAGKLNHAITCDKCQKCFSKIIAHKVIFCKAH